VSISSRSTSPGDVRHVSDSRHLGSCRGHRARTMAVSVHRPRGRDWVRWATLVALALAWLLLPAAAWASGELSLVATGAEATAGEGRGATLVAVVLLVVAIGLHALYREPR
jgi:hypothetical protein